MSRVSPAAFPLPLLLTPAKAADVLGLARSSLRKLLKAGKIKAKLIEGRHYFVTASLLAYNDSLPDA